MTVSPARIDESSDLELACAEVVGEEEALLKRNLERLAKPRPETQIDVDGIVREMDTLRDQMRDADHDERPGMLMQYERLGHVLEQAGKSVDLNKVDPNRPYFGHMRLEENGKVRDVFLGKATRLDNGLRIVDWRHAPVSRIFYRYAEGDEYDEDFGDREVGGEVLVRRTLAIQGGELKRVQSPQGMFQRKPDGTWNAQDASGPTLAGGAGGSWVTRSAADLAEGGTLGAGAAYRIDKHLPEISALIDPDQWKLISAPDSELVVVRGVAGSGKTTVGLHRMAYLNYQDRRRYRADRMMVVVWGDALRRFISKVLPSLGVKGTPVRTFARWARETRERLFNMLPVDTHHDTPAIVTRLKLHPAMLPIIEEQVKRRKAPATTRQVLDDWMHLVTSRRVLLNGLNKHAKGAFTEREIDRVLEWTNRQVDLMEEHLNPDGAPEGVDEEERDRVHKQAFLDDEDDALLLRLYQLRVGKIPARGRSGRPLRYQHMLIDEVQDFSPLEVRVLMNCADEQKSMTLAGDTQQHVLQEAGFTNWEQFFSHLGVAGTGVSTLQVAYRSTKPIVEFSRAVLGHLAEDEHVEVVRDGVPVEILPFEDHGECLAFLADALRRLEAAEPHASVALLARNEETAEAYYDGLERAGLENLRLVENQNFSFGPGIEVTEMAQAKGLEFDYVVLLDVSRSAFPDTDAARRLLHVGATRAMHQLWVMSVGPLSEILPTPAV
jgi:DNA helicase-2/ATP-dependent DNA helicase PcrA